tara:strand:- start:249 stop:548 length:300 start_codon:yes stop_codon:yes gene_type:complete
MKHIKWLAVIVVLFLGYSNHASAQSYNQAENNLIQHVSKNGMGGIKTYWLEKSSIPNMWSKVILVFGFPRNQEACIQLIKQEKKLYPNDRAGYRCSPAN